MCSYTNVRLLLSYNNSIILTMINIIISVIFILFLFYFILLYFTMFPQLLLIVIIIIIIRFVVVVLTLASFWCIMGGKGGAWLCAKISLIIHLLLGFHRYMSTTTTITTFGMRMKKNESLS